MLGRIRFFGDALAWPYFMSFAISVSAKCGLMFDFNAQGWELFLGSIFYLLVIIFVGREVMYYVYVLGDPVGTNRKMLANLSADGHIGPTGHYEAAKKSDAPLAVPGMVEMSSPSTTLPSISASSSDAPRAAVSTSSAPAKANPPAEAEDQDPHNLTSLARSFRPSHGSKTDELPGVKADFGDCMPRNAVFGGFFRPLSEEADDGRIVFVPVPKRDGLYIASGLVMLEHLCLGISAFVEHVPHTLPPLFFGAIAGFAGRLGEKKIENLTYARLSVRVGELLWMFCCMRQEGCASF